MLLISPICFNQPCPILLSRPCAVLLVTKTGGGILKAGHVRAALADRRAFMLKPDQEVVFEGSFVSGHLIQFQPVLLSSYLQQHYTQRVSGLFDVQAPLPFADSDMASFYFSSSLLGHLIDEITIASHRIIFQPYLFLLWWHMNRKVAELIIKPTMDERIVEKFMVLLEEHYINERNAPFYSGMLGINPRKLQYVLDKMTGKTFLDFWQERMFLQADLMLHDPEISLKEIAYVLGYSDQSHFTKKYSMYKGISPGKYRSFTSNYLHTV